MKRFNIAMRTVKEQTLVIRAETAQEAIEKAQAALPDYSVETVNDRLFIATCEVSDKPIFEGDDYLCDDEGTYWLKEYDDPNFYLP